MSLVDVEVRKREKEQRQEKKERRSRIYKLSFIGSLFTVLLAGLMVRVFYIKTVHGEEYERLSLLNEYNRVNIESTLNPNRGSIVDRNNQSLAISHTVYSIFLDVRYLVEESKEDQTKTVENLSLYLGIPESELKALLIIDPATGKPAADTHYYMLAKKVPRATKNELMESGVKHVYAETDTLRSYVHDNLASQVIGFIRGDAKWGLELKYDAEMSGQEGRMFRYYDARNNPVTEQKDPIDGYTLVTTLDTNIQRFAEEAALEYGLKYEAQNTLVMAMNPMTGELLAMAQYPTFNLNEPSNTAYFSDAGIASDASVELTQEEELNNLYRVWANYAVSSTFEPGSIFKPIVVAAALEEGIISKNSMYYCDGGEQIYDKYIKCWIKDYGTVHGEVTLTQVLAYSCNDGMMEIGRLLGRDFFYKYQHDFGFGEPTGIDLPGEAHTASLLYSKTGLNPAEVGSSSIGQGFNCTAIQALTAFSAVINGGNLMKPYIVSQVIDRNGAVVRENNPEVVSKVISKDTSKFMRETMREVVARGATGEKAIIEGYAIGGKTGTAQQGEKIEGEESEYVISFIAYLPVENPEIIALALINRPKEYIEGSTSTAPMLQSVLQKIITYKAIPPGDGSEAAAALVENSITIEDYIGESIKEVSKNLNGRGIDFECIGNGDKIINQTPKPGSVGDKDTQLLFYLSESGNADLVLLPDVRNASPETAKAILENAGLTAYVQIEGKVAQPKSDEAGEGEETVEEEQTTVEETNVEEESTSVVAVYTQMPSADIRIERGTEIKLKAR